jgi:methionyl-tRNA formyltransferase
MTRILFIGTVQFSRDMLGVLIRLGAQVVGVCTRRESPQNADFADLSTVCVTHGIDCLYVDDLNSVTSLAWMRAKAPDVILCFGWSALLKKPLLELAPMGVIGYHPAALPRNRGRHPLIWALALGLPSTASTFFFMDEGADSGDILFQEEVGISRDDDAASLYRKITEIAARQVAALVPLLNSRSCPRRPQDHAQANLWRKRGQNDGEIDFRMGSESIRNLVRALTRPYVGAHVVYKGGDYKVWKVDAVPCDRIHLEPGKVVGMSGAQVTIKTADGAIRLIDHEIPLTLSMGDYLL